MSEVDLNGMIMWALAAIGDWASFDQLDRAIEVEAKDLKPEVRRSMLRGELGRMIASGQIARQRFKAVYRISDETLSLFRQDRQDQ